MNEIFGTWYSVHDGLKLIITDSEVCMYTNIGMSDPSSYDLIKKEKYLGQSNGTNISITDTLTVFEYSPLKGEMLVLEKGEKLSVSFIKR